MPSIEHTQCESTPFRSNSVYGTSKIIGLQMTELFRNLYNLHVSTAILYNHESPRREEHFVSQKIVKGLIKIKRNETERLELGNLDDVKDWGFARDYAYGMWLMAQAHSPGDYILATGTGHTVADFVKEAADALELEKWPEMVTVQPRLTRPVTKTRLVGDPHRAQTALGKPMQVRVLPSVPVTLHIWVWRSQVAHAHGAREVECSSHSTQTIRG